MMLPWTALGLVVAGYILGSLSTAIITCRVLRRPDPRSGGSRNPGATNVLRLAGRDAAAITLAGDLLKGVLPVLLARWLSDDPMVWLLAGTGAFLGHLYPIFFGFVGGKGVATALGVLLAAVPVAGALTVATWLVAFAIARQSAIGALTAFLLAPLWVALTHPTTAPVVVTGALSLILIGRHRSNIQAMWAARRGHSR